MTHSQMLSLLMQTAGPSLTVQRAIEILNRVQNEMVSRVPGLNRVLPTPFLATTSGTFTYTASTSIYGSAGGTQGSLVGDVMLVGKEVYSYQDSSYNLYAYNGFGGLNNRPPFIDQPLSTGKVKQTVDVIPSKRPGANDCQIIFWAQKDPSTTTTRYYVDAYLWPTQITTASTTLYLTIPEQFQHKGLLWGCLRDLNIAQYQDLGNPAVLFENDIAEAKKWANRFVDSAPTRTPLRW